jgi:hypothetical protein
MEQLGSAKQQHDDYNSRSGSKTPQKSYTACLA